MVEWVLDTGPESIKNFSEYIHYLQESEYQKAEKELQWQRPGNYFDSS
jgi:hypothetical protein